MTKPQVNPTQQEIEQLFPFFNWIGKPQDLFDDSLSIKKCLLTFELPIYAVRDEAQIKFTNQARLTSTNGGESNLAGWLPPISHTCFGDQEFLSTYHVKAAYYAGGMANGIASEKMVIGLAREGLLGCFGSGGLSIDRIEKAIQAMQSTVGNSPYMFNLLHNPFEPEIEKQTVDIYMKNNVRVVEAAAYLRLTPAVVQYRAAGLKLDQNGNVSIENHVIAKISRKEIALLFLKPAPQDILDMLVKEGKISAEQGMLAGRVPMADDITVEADSGGHTDNQPLVSLLPSIIALRDQMQKEGGIQQRVRIGAAGGISTPDAALAAYLMGAAYVVTGSINQACVESGACDHTKKLLADAEMADVTMAPSADMFEMGAKVQVLKRGTMFAMRAQKLFNLYNTYTSIEEIPAAERKDLETRIFMRPTDEIWQETKEFFSKRNPDQIQKAEQNPKKKMALIFRWYLGLSSRWSRDGTENREMDYQIWCGPSMGAFNEWVHGTYLEDFCNRHVADVAWQLLRGCAYRFRVQSLKLQGVNIPNQISSYYPEEYIADKS